MALHPDDVREFIRENDIKFIRLTFCTLEGVQKNIAILAEELPRAFESGIIIDMEAVARPLGVARDAFLFPKADTLAILPWRPIQARVARFFCDIRAADGSAHPADGRHLLSQTCRALETSGLCADIALACEFTLFEADERGNPTQRPYDDAGYLDVAPLDRAENIRREICLALEEMDIHPASSRHARGPGQNAIELKRAGALRVADSVVTFRNITQVFAARNGLCASFASGGAQGHRMIPRVTLNRLDRSGGETDIAQLGSFFAGMKVALPRIVAFLSAPSGEAARFMPSVAADLPSADSGVTLDALPAAINPYIAFALLFSAGLEGLGGGLPTQGDLARRVLPEAVYDYFTQDRK